MRILVLFLLVSFSGFSQKQPPFEGKLVYQIELTDTLLADMYKARDMVIYTNDTLARIVNYTDQLGEQVVIKHLQLHKSYLLLNTPVGKFAIQTKRETDSIAVSDYTFRKKGGKKVIAGIKAKKLIVQHPEFKEEMVFWYAKKVPGHVLEGFENFPGLLLEYYVPTPDGIYQYTLKNITEQPTPKDLYGVPSDYQKMTMDRFIELMTSGSEE